MTGPQRVAERYSLIDFFGSISGSGWHNPEIVDGISFRWSTGQAELRVPLIPGSYARFRLYVRHFMNDVCLETLRIFLDDAELEWTYDVRPQGSVVMFDQRAPAARRLGRLTFELEAGRENTADGRLLGLAANRLEMIYHDGRMPQPTLSAAPRAGS